ncbi:MAG: hypothetical protein MI806_27035 [Minwuiales bacterium]|nr:hypothetical protein [Minwuiales bacterium]
MIGKRVLAPALFAALALLPLAAAAEPCRKGPECRALFPLAEGLALPVYRSHALDAPSATIARAVVVIHGYRRDAHRYFPTMTEAAAMQGLEEETLIVAPHFTVQKDRSAGAVYWRRNRNWRRGDRSADLAERRISSFAAVERLLAHLGRQDLFPNLGKITVVGHSAGGQFVQRFAAGHGPIPALATVRLRYIAANSGTYMYLSRERPAPDFDGDFTAPGFLSLCGTYNEYAFGLGDLNAFMARAGAPTVIRRARERELVLLLGEKDRNRRHEGLNRGCEASLQGRHRLERGLMFKAHLDHFHAPHRTSVVVVPGVGHSNRDLFRSARGRAAIFF